MVFTVGKTQFGLFTDEYGIELNVVLENGNWYPLGYPETVNELLEWIEKEKEKTKWKILIKA